MTSGSVFKWPQVSFHQCLLPLNFPFLFCAATLSVSMQVGNAPQHTLRDLSAESEKDVSNIGQGQIIGRCWEFSPTLYQPVCDRRTGQ